MSTTSSSPWAHGNVKFVWSPVGRSGKHGIDLKTIYPGDKYVDYMAITAANWGAPRWRTMTQVLEAKLSELEAITQDQTDHDRRAGHVSRRR